MATVPNEVILNDSLRKQNAILEKLTAFLQMAYLQTQEEESEKTPRRVRPFTVNVNAQLGQPAGTTPLAMQVLPRNMARNSVGLYNIGPGDLIFANSWFDPASILQQFSDPNFPDVVAPLPNQVIQIGFLPKGSAASFDATEAIWVYNIGSNAVLTMTETVFARAGRKEGVMPKPAGIDGAIGAGYVAHPDTSEQFPMAIKALR